ncbi:DUF3558 domain-containing protein [Corynebacterium pacaense]|uniref:DUF3558 domain-containing protein n=1 Tax=Corynebacterium pacaense TaxID=1816684 RepID=UPI0009BB7249|nr:DUF3558 domain-containing protein [Corynebacterium pacaense]
MRTRGLLVLTVCLGAVTACSQTAVTEAPPPIDAHTDTTHPTHDRSAGLLDAQFDPCTDLTEEQLSAAGLENKMTSHIELPEGVKSCGWVHVDRENHPGTYLIGTDQVDQEHMISQGLEVIQRPDTQTAGLYTHRMDPLAGEACGAAVDFEWGRVMVSYTHLGGHADYLELCSRPVIVLDNLIQKVGENH